MAATTENQGPKTPKAPPTPKVKAPPATPTRGDPAAPVLADPKVKPHEKGKGKGEGEGEGQDRDRSRSPIVHLEQQPRRRRYLVDSTSGQGQHAPKEGIVTTAIPKTPRERIVLLGEGRVYVMHSCKQSVQREKTVSILMTRKPLLLSKHPSKQHRRNHLDHRFRHRVVVIPQRPHL